MAQPNPWVGLCGPSCTRDGVSRPWWLLANQFRLLRVSIGARHLRARVGCHLRRKRRRGSVWTDSRSALRAYARRMSVAALQPFYEGWATHQALVIDALRGLTPEQLDLRTAHASSVGGLAVGWSRCRFAGVLVPRRARRGRPVDPGFSASTAPLFQGLPLEGAGWEDDEDHPRSAEELVDGLRRSWSMVDDRLRRWTAEDLDASVVRPSRTHHRGWVVWHVMEHDLHHGGEISPDPREQRTAGSRSLIRGRRVDLSIRWNRKRWPVSCMIR